MKRPLPFPSFFLHGLGTGMRRIAALVGRRLAYSYFQQATDRPFVTTARPLNPAERTSIWVYTSPDGWYERINSELRDGEPSPPVAGFVPVLDEALSRLFRHPGSAYRGISLGSLSDLTTDYRVGGTVTWDAYSSTSTDQKKAFWGNVLFIITSKNGCIVDKLSAVPDEGEVIFERRSRFRVVYCEVGTDFACIELNEV